MKIGRVLVIANQLKPEATELSIDIRNYLESLDIETIVLGLSGKPSQPALESFDLAISLGGDGTVLYSSRILAHRRIPILPINLGEFGFITEVTREEWKDAFEKFRSGKLVAGSRLVLRTRVVRSEREILSTIGLNETVIASSGISKIVRLHAFLSGCRLGSYRADGIIVATPTGSTAYSAAAGGPILHPEMDAMIINPICPFTLSARPLVVPGTERIEIFISESQRTELSLTVDGQTNVPVLPRDTIIIERSEDPALIVRSDRRTFYDVLRSKLRWSGEPNA